MAAYDWRTTSAGEDLGTSKSRIMSVSMNPPWKPTTCVPCAFSSARRLLVSAQAADLVTPYAPSIGVLIQLRIDRMFRMAPPPLRPRMSANARLMFSTPNRLVSSWSRSSETASPPTRPPGRPMPALLMTSVTSGHCTAAAATSSTLVTSSLTGITPGSVTLDGSRAPA